MIPFMFLPLLVLLVLPVVAVPRFNVDLDVDPEERWKDVLLYYKSLGAIEALESQPSVTPPEDVRQFWMATVEAQLDEDYEGEIRGFIKYGGFSRTTLLTFIARYEMNHPEYCSGLLAAMPNGTVVHGRNMDYPLTLEINGKRVGWPELTVEVTFLRGGKPLMTSVTWPGQLGIHTAMRFDGWTFEQNTRRTGDDLQKNTEAAKQGGRLYGLSVRRLMERVPDFETAVQELWSANLAATCYWIVTGKGPYEAAVLSMDRLGLHESSSPPLMRLSAENSTWHLLQTNDDMTGKPQDDRRPTENRRLAGFNQSQVSPEWVFREMHGKALSNSMTVFTWIAVPATNFYKTVLPRGTWGAQPEICAEESTSLLGKTFLPPRLPPHPSRL